MKRVVIGVLVALVVAYIGAVAFLYANQRAFFFAPDGDIWTIEDVGLSAEEVIIPTGGGETITGWYRIPNPGMGSILYLKGNTGSFSAEYERLQAFEAAGYGFLAVDYRGFPLSPGTISEQNILDDALSAFDWLSERHDNIFVWGRSLGASPAVWVASQREALAVLLETPFVSAVGVAAERYPYVPVGWLMWDQFRSDEWIGEVTEPVYVVHGTADTIVSVGNGERLYGMTTNGYDLWIEEGAGHSDMWGRGLWERAQAFFEEIQYQLIGASE